MVSWYQQLSAGGGRITVRRLALFTHYAQVYPDPPGRFYSGVGYPVPDSEGATDSVFGVQGTCGNSVDDDQVDIDGSTEIGDSPGEIDGSPDDGCPVTV